MGAAVQAVVDFLVDERCRVCGEALRAIDAGGDRECARDALAAPVRISIGPLRVATRLLCEPCAGRVRPWREPVRLAAGAGAHAGGSPLIVYPAFATGDVLLRLIHVLKFERQERVGPWLARAISTGCPRRALDDLPAPAVLVPVPMDARSRRRRGFNQADRIANELGRAWKVPVASTALSKTRRTLAQSSLGRSERARNLARAIAPGSESIAGMCAILVDDLVTTGATAAACAEVLRRAGVESVRVVCVGYRP